MKLPGHSHAQLKLLNVFFINTKVFGTANVAACFLVSDNDLCTQFFRDNAINLYLSHIPVAGSQTF